MTTCRLSKILITSYLLILILFLSISLSQPKREIRAVWLTTNYQLDWPPKTYNTEIQKKSLVEILDNLKSKNFNTIYFQVRSQGTVLYKSKYEPWSQYLKGKMGTTPDYDPLQFIIEEAHKRNIEVHAWLNMVNVKSGDSPIEITDPPHIIISRPEWVRVYNENGNVTYWLDPGFPEVREYLKNLCVEIVENYDLDGIHLDYIRYPGVEFDDSISYQMYGQGKSREDFRRENINLLVASIYDAVTSIKPIIKVGSAPIGIYENILGARGWEGRNSVFQDSREWLRRKKQDYIVPQVYWDINTNPKFENLVEDWTKNNFGRQVVVGIGAYNPSVEKELEQQIEITRKYKAAGQSFFRYENIRNKTISAYRYPANIPPMNWKDSIPPNPPYSLTGRNIPGKLGLIELVWGIPLKAIDGDTAKYYNIYRSTNPKIDRENPAYILSSTSNYYFYDFIRRPSQIEFYYQVSSFDKNHNESVNATEVVKVELSNLKEILKPNYPNNLVAFRVKKNAGSLFIESDAPVQVLVILYDKLGNKLMDLDFIQLKTGLNYIEFEVPPSRLKEYSLKILYPDRVDIIEFRI